MEGGYETLQIPLTHMPDIVKPMRRMRAESKILQTGRSEWLVLNCSLLPVFCKEDLQYVVHVSTLPSCLAPQHIDILNIKQFLRPLLVVILHHAV